VGHRVLQSADGTMTGLSVAAVSTAVQEILT
jgi:hypothetical protein